MLEFVRGRGGEFITLWTFLKEFCVYDLVSLLNILAECACVAAEKKPILPYLKEGLVRAAINGSQSLLDIGLVTSVNVASDFISRVGANQFSDEGLAVAANTLFKTIEMESRSIIAYRAFSVPAFDFKLPFGAKIAAAFPDCGEDILEAHKCLQFGRYTACAFHIGRAMESAVKSVGQKLKIKPSRDEWQSYITAINIAVNKMPFNTPKQKAKRAVISEASNYLFNFKEAWRNPTMHAKRTYTDAEASELLSSARFFLAHAADKIMSKQRR